MLTYQAPPTTEATIQKDHSWLLLLLSLTWLVPGLFGHAPWRNEEVEVLTVIRHMLSNGNWMIPHFGSQVFLENPPLTYWAGAIFAYLFSPWLLSLHEAARLAAAVMMGLSFLFIGMAGRQLWDKKQGRIAVLLLMGSFGLIARAHLIMPEQGNFLGHALVLYGLSIIRTQLFYSATLAGIGIALSFLGGGTVAILPTTLAALLVLFDKPLNSINRIQWTLVLFVTAIPLALAWPLALQEIAPSVFAEWKRLHWDNLSFFLPKNALYYCSMMAWFAWPIWPLALGQLLRHRRRMFEDRTRLILLGMSLCWLWEASLSPEQHDVKAIIVLLPLALLATPAANQLKRGWTAAFNWFSRFTFTGFIALAWFGWFVLAFEMPSKLAARMHRASPSYVHEDHWYWLLFAIAMTGAWVWMSIRPKVSGRIAIANWAIGLTAAWGLAMTLWMPWVEAAKDYRPMLDGLYKALPTNECVNGNHTPTTVRGLLYFYYGVDLTIGANASYCRWSLIQANKKDADTSNQLVWRGSRAGDKKKRFA